MFFNLNYRKPSIFSSIMEKIVNQALLKRNMLIASLFVTSFEMLKNTIQEKIKSFLCPNSTYNAQGEFEYEISNEYRSDVLDKNIPGINRKRTPEYHLFYSSCLWLRENSVLTKTDFLSLQQIRKHRNLIAHEPVRLLIDENLNVNMELLRKAQGLLNKIEKWWVVNFEIQVNSFFDGQKIDESDIKTG